MFAWVDVDTQAAKPYVEGLLLSGVEIVERIAIHILDRRFDVLRIVVPKAISPALFDAAHKHELYHLLKNHFQQLTDDEKGKVLGVIRDLPLPDRGDNSEEIRRSIQLNWLRSIEGKGYEPAESWLSQLNEALGDAGFVPPDFNSYHQTRWGSGPTPHEAQELVAFVQAGSIVDHLNAFAPSNDWNGPSKRSLVRCRDRCRWSSAGRFSRPIAAIPRSEAGIPIRAYRWLQEGLGCLGRSPAGLPLGPRMAETCRLLRSSLDKRGILEGSGRHRPRPHPHPRLDSSADRRVP